MNDRHNSPILTVENLSFTIDKVNVLTDVSFQLLAGDHLSIVGPNGAGKSTLLKCLLRLHEKGKQLGNITVDGKKSSLYTQKQLARMISYVPQAGGWIPPFSVQDFVRLSRFPYTSATGGFSQNDEMEVERALELTGMTELKKRNLKSLSGGERQKAYLAAALAQRAPIMLLDEPAAALDPKHTSELSALLRKLNQEEKLTMLIVTHDLNQPLRAAGLSLVLAAGRMSYFGPTASLLESKVLEDAFQHHFLYLEHPSGQGKVVISE
ncbi:MAG: ABC transporter ATP-binding protein [Deltaproteobacteria bacterium]|jgi:iron complex transport system ATP-binding protein|nr:ABC transporter ATP-binding protein [Deltaproteobacteria bacterium]